VRAGLVINDGLGRIDLRVVQRIGERRRLVLEVTPLGAGKPRLNCCGMRTQLAAQHTSVEIWSLLPQSPQSPRATGAVGTRGP
jgi:hypothetical protein